MTAAGGLRFVSWTRRGLIALPGADTGHLSVAAQISENGAPPTTSTAVDLALYTPGDVLALDITTITRRYPRQDTTDAETEFFPLVEFSAPELPWLLPGPGGLGGGPQPWLCLVVVEVGPGVTLVRDVPSRPMQLTIASPALVNHELPDLASIALWAHAWAPTIVQTGAGDPADPGAPAPVGSRLVAPRNLLPQTRYVACLVPTTKAGALAGTGAALDAVHAAGTAPAWTTTDTSVTLPVYDSWQFATGAAGDFESLARSLVERPVPDDFGSRALDLGLAGPGMPDDVSTGWRFRGALTSPKIAPAADWPGADVAIVDDALRQEVHAVARLTSTGRPVLGPLLYARAAAGRGDVSDTSPAVDWFEQLNRDPRMRSAAGLGSRVLRRNVETVMAQAWEQVGDVRAANAVLRRLQLSRQLAISLHDRHLGALLPAKLLGTSRAVLSRVSLPTSVTGGVAAAHALDAVAASALPAGSLWRGVTVALRPGSALGTAASAGTRVDSAARVITGLLATGLPESAQALDGTLSMAAPSAVFAGQADALITEQLNAAATAVGLSSVPAGGDPAARLTALDTLISQGGSAVTAASSAMASQTAASVLAHQLPTSVEITTVGGSIGVYRSADVFAASTLGGTTAPHFAGTTIVAQSQSQSPGVGAPTLPKSLAPISGPISGPITGPISSLPPVVVPVQPIDTVVLKQADPRLQAMQKGVAEAVDRFVRPGTSTPLPAPVGFDLAGAASGVLGALHPASTFAALARSRVPGREIIGTDDVAPVMVGPVFGDPTYLMLANASHEAFVPGLDSIPPDSVTLLATNPPFITAFLAGLNSALGHELLWRDYPGDDRGTYFYSFWGAGDDIGPLHRFAGRLESNLLSGTKPLLVLVLKGRLLRRYPDSDVYALLGGTTATSLDTDPSTIIRPLFRDRVDPDITLVGFPLTLDQVMGPPAGQAYWFAIAEHPGSPRFGLVDADPALSGQPLTAWDELTWLDLGSSAVAETYLPVGPPTRTPSGTTRHWASSSSDMAAITYQPPVRVVLRATELLSTSTTSSPSPNPPTE